MNRKIISFAPEVKNVNYSNIYNSDFKNLGNILGFEAIITNNIRDLFSLVNQDKDVNTIILDIDQNADNIDLIDIINSVNTIRKLQNYNDINIVAYTKNQNIDADTIKKILRTGVKGFAIEGNLTFDDKVEFLSEILAGHKYIHKYVKERLNEKLRKKKLPDNEIILTPRQQEVLELVCTRGASNKNIARILHLSESTVKLHMGAILKKYGLTNRTQLALFAKKK